MRSRWVVKVSGTPMEEPGAHGALWRAIGGLRRDGCEVVLVHGGGRAVDAHLARLGMETTRIDGLRCTPSEQMLEVAGVLGGRVNKLLVSALCGVGCSAVGVSLADGGEIVSKRVGVELGDLGRVGEIVGGDAKLVRVLLEGGYVPVVASIGGDREGLLNINADDAAGGLAGLLGFDGVVFLSDVEGVRIGDGSIAPELDAIGCERLIERGVIRGGMIAKVRAAGRCAARTGRPAIIASYGAPDSLGEIVRGGAVGTRIVASGGVNEKSRVDDQTGATA